MNTKAISEYNKRKKKRKEISMVYGLTRYCYVFVVVGIHKITQQGGKKIRKKLGKTTTKVNIMSYSFRVNMPHVEQKSRH